MPNTLLEIWQANAAGRYVHRNDQWPGPLDPNFLGIGRCLTDASGAYRFLTIRPGAYPWKNHPNAWRPAHIHFSLLGPSWVSRLVTQMYFPDDPLHGIDPIFSSVPEAVRPRLIASYAHDVTEPEWALGWRWDIVLRGPGPLPSRVRRRIWWSLSLTAEDSQESQSMTTLGTHAFSNGGAVLPGCVSCARTCATTSSPGREPKGSLFGSRDMSLTETGAGARCSGRDLAGRQPGAVLVTCRRPRRAPSSVRRSFVGFGRSGTDESGRFWFETIKPGRGPAGW